MFELLYSIPPLSTNSSITLVSYHGLVQVAIKDALVGIDGDSSRHLRSFVGDFLALSNSCETALLPLARPRLLAEAVLDPRKGARAVALRPTATGVLYRRRGLWGRREARAWS